MIPLHKDTVGEICDFLEAAAPLNPPRTICGYPLPGWRLQRVEHDDGRELKAAPGWIVSLHSEPKGSPLEHDRRRYRCVMTRSLLGPLEAWDEAIQIALRENAAAAERDAAAAEREA